MDADRREIVLLFAQALAQTTAPDLMVRSRRVALNFAEAVAQRRRAWHWAITVDRNEQGSQQRYLARLKKPIDWVI